MSLGDMSYRRAPTFYDHLDHNIILFKTKQSRSLAGDVWVWRNRFNTVCFPLVHHERFRLLKFGVVHLPQNGPQELLFNLRPASNEKCSASVLMSEKTVCFFASPTNWDKSLASKNAQHSAWRWFGIFQVTCEIGILEETQFAFWRKISLMTIVSGTSCEVDGPCEVI